MVDVGKSVSHSVANRAWAAAAAAAAVVSKHSVADDVIHSAGSRQQAAVWVGFAHGHDRSGLQQRAVGR